MGSIQATPDAGETGVLDLVTKVEETSDIALFLRDIASKDIRVSLIGDKLRCTGPVALLQGPLGQQIRDLKPAIIAHLASVSDAIPARGLTLAALSPAQARLWLVETIDPAAGHHIPFAIEATGALDVAAMTTALTRIMDRHVVLRLRIVQREGTVWQQTAAPSAPPVHHIDARGLADTDIAALIADEAARPFDLADQPPLRVSVLDCGDDRRLLLFTLHHIAADGSSVEILMAEFAAFYREAVTGLRSTLPDLPIQYGDYADWLNGEEGSARHLAQMRFWREQLGEDLPVTRLSGDFPRPPVQDHRGALHPLTIPADLTTRLRQLGASHGASLFAVLLAAFNLLVHRHTGQRDVLIGIPSANRNRAETEPLVGLFVNPLPIRSRIDPAAGFGALLDEVRGNVVAALDHQDVPFEELVAAFQTRRDPSASPLFQLKFQLDRAPREVLDLPGVSLRRLPRQGGTARHDLSLDLVEGPGGVSGHLEFATALFRPETVAALAGHYLNLLVAIAADPDQPVALLPMLGADERQRLLNDWNDSAREIDPAQRFPALFEAHAKATPDAIAVEFIDGERITEETYAALNARANRLAHALRAAGAGPDRIIGIALDRGIDMVAAWLAVLKSGAAYLPLDPAYPADRLAYMLADSGAELVLSHSHIGLPEGIARWNLDESWPDGPETNPIPGADPDDLAYLIYTSGSTGRPKGVEIPHAGLVNLTLDKLQTCGPRPGGRVMGFFSFSFDASIPDLVMALGSGGRLVTAPAADVLPGPSLARIMRDRRVTHLTITPSALACLPDADFPDLRMVLVGGEAPAPELVGRWSTGRLFINAYGPTECTVNASMVPCGNGHPVEPTLMPPANKRLHVLDEAMELLPPGCAGELYIGGLGLARGYRARPDLTAAAFLPDPYGPPGARLYRTGDRAVRLADGRIRLLGRMDDQVKIRGFRIEPEEIARTCRRHPSIEAAVVAPRSIAGMGQRLVAWLVARAPVSDADLRAHLLTTLPRHMIPDDLVWLNALPLTVNGKLDLRALPDPTPGHGKGRAPEGPTETALAAIFADLLGIADPSAEDDFFDLGGNSLMATRLVAAIADRLGATLKVLDLFDASTIAAMAQLIEGGPAHANDDWRADLTLDPAIRPAGPFRKGLGDQVLLSGATGFVGAHLLAELLSDPAQKVMLLVRQDGVLPIRQVFERYGLPTDNLARVTPIKSDLAAPGLGLTPSNRQRIVAQTTSILHCGARVHHATPYRGLAATNVAGTVELLALAAEARCPFHHISTLSALMPGDAVIAEDVTARDVPAPAGGYNQTKWVAEQLVVQAAARGLPVTIHRLGSVSGDSRTGAFNEADILSRQVQGYLTEGAAPEGTALINMIPVDYVARAICQLAADPAHEGRIFHLTHSTPVTSDALFAAMEAEGHAPRRLPAQDWQALMVRIAQGAPDHPLYPLAALGGAQGFTGNRWPYSCTATRTALENLPEPPLTEALLRLYVRALAAALPPKETRP
ncbi:amino acid adenylation domain-containing protein [Paracoccus caeni]|uniref:Amino acid adenylation domain-containing protein n=1 Tax=Paracoccus caeni TaxID=657651 RepID=A0A934SIY8_9RHOB|nr:non-ribosomal peptide synthetase [Paracoccus caeni]MBK4215974.1 amino acid adenylation domain-containing protein [Paracoccus caeni]